MNVDVLNVLILLSWIFFYQLGLPLIWSHSISLRHSGFYLAIAFPLFLLLVDAVRTMILDFGKRHGSHKQSFFMLGWSQVLLCFFFVFGGRHKVVQTVLISVQVKLSLQFMNKVFVFWFLKQKRSFLLDWLKMIVSLCSFTPVKIEIRDFDWTHSGFCWLIKI